MASATKITWATEQDDGMDVLVAYLGDLYVGGYIFDPHRFPLLPGVSDALIDKAIRDLTGASKIARRG